MNGPQIEVSHSTSRRGNTEAPLDLPFTNRNTDWTGSPINLTWVSLGHAIIVGIVTGQTQPDYLIP